MSNSGQANSGQANGGQANGGQATEGPTMSASCVTAGIGQGAARRSLAPFWRVAWGPVPGPLGWSRSPIVCLQYTFRSPFG